MRPISICEVINATGGRFEGTGNVNEKAITSVTMDSRKAVKGSLFVAIKGEKTDGHVHMGQAFEKGAVCAICDHIPEGVQGNFVVVSNTVKALQDLAEWYRSTLSAKVVGITGSVGKTSTKEIVASVLSKHYKVQKTEGNYNNEIGLPLTVLAIEEDCEISVLEMGISDFGEMRLLSRVAKPDICVITNIGQCHLEFLHTRDGILKAKAEIFEYMNPEGSVYLNGDDDKLITVSNVYGKLPTFYGFDTKNDVHLLSMTTDGLKGTHMVISVRGTVIESDFHMLGKHMVSNAMAASAIGYDLGMSVEEIAKGLEDSQTIAGRNNVIHYKEAIIIDDCYNASPTSMQAALDTICLLKGRRIAVLGDMFELGPDSDSMHAEIGRYASETAIDKLICIGNNCRSMYEAALETAHGKKIAVYYDSPEEYLASDDSKIIKGDIILVKSSHGMNFSKIVEELQKK